MPVADAPFTAVVRVRGERERLPAFRERVRWLLVRDIEAETYTEHHAEEFLEYRFTLLKGVPFPVFATASGEFPGLRVETEWRDEERGVAGRAVIEEGRLLENASETIAERSHELDVAVGKDGQLVLALACRDEGDAISGYAASADRHAYFRYRPLERSLETAEGAGERWTTRYWFAPGGRLEAEEPLDEPLGDALESLESLAFEFAEQWLWYDESPPEETAVERARYADYGSPVRGANIRSAALARLRAAAAREDNALRQSSLGERGRAAREALLAGWLRVKHEK